VVGAESELERPVQLLDLMKFELVLPSISLLTRDRLTFDELTVEAVIAYEQVHRVGYTRARGRRDQAVEQDEVTRKPAVTGDVTIAGWTRVIPTRSIGPVQIVPVLPGGGEIAFGGKHDEVHVAEVVRLTTGKRPEQDDTQKRQLSSSSGKL
jgi:hypothetical protein